ADIWFVRSVKAHCIGILHPWKVVQNNTFYTFEKLFDHTLKNIQDIFLLNKGKLAIDLRKLGLTVCPKTFIPEAFDDLKIAVETRDHQKLLEGLGRLRKGIKLARVHPAWHHKIAGSFRSRFYQYRRFYFQKILTV